MSSITRIPFVDLKSQHSFLSGEIAEAIDGIVGQASFTLGRAVSEFEQAFADYCGASYGVGVGSGTDALHFALRGLGVGPGDEVITVPNTFIATVEAIHMCGARPVLVDIDRSTYLLDVERLKAAITKKTKAVIPVHLFGHPADMAEIRKICVEHDIKVVEDACQAHGASIGSEKTGSFGDAACFSFYPSKNLGGIGDGGMAVTDDPVLRERIERLRNHGEGDKHNHIESGYCSRLHAVQAAVLSVKLKYLDRWNNARRFNAGVYDSFFKDSPVIEPLVKRDFKHVYHLYVVQVENRDSLQSHLASEGIDAAVHYPTPIHLQPAFKHLGYGVGSFPVAEGVVSRILSLPMYPELRENDIRRVAAEVLEFTLGHYRAA